MARKRNVHQCGAFCETDLAVIEQVIKPHAYQSPPPFLCR